MNKASTETKSKDIMVDSYRGRLQRPGLAKVLPMSCFMAMASMMNITAAQSGVELLSPRTFSRLDRSCSCSSFKISSEASTTFMRNTRGLHNPLNVATPKRRIIAAFGNPKYFTNKYIPSQKPGVELKVPNFEVLLDDICKLSPMAKQALHEEKPGGISAIEKNSDIYEWKVTDNNPNRLISHISKIDNFQNNGVPLIRLRCKLHGPTKRRGESFAELITTNELRHRWDPTIDNVDEIYSANLDEVKEVQEHKYGEPSLFGVGYVKTKKSVVSPREQLTLCGLQNFASGASLIWGVELEEDQNHLFPKDGKRRRRSTSHIFSTAIIPTGENEFEVEYVLQLEIGDFPGWLTGPVVTETVKGMFRFAEGYFKSGLDGGELSKRLAAIPDVDSNSSKDDLELDPNGLLDEKQALLMPP